MLLCSTETEVTLRGHDSVAIETCLVNSTFDVLALLSQKSKQP